MLDLRPTAWHVTRLIEGVTDDQLTAPTPCSDYTLGDLLSHLDELSVAFRLAARKDTGGITAQGPSPDAARLGDDWRTRIPQRLSALAESWRDPAAWRGMTQAGGVELPGDAAGTIATNELVLHGWDVARASGQQYDCDPQALDAALEFVMATPEEGPEREGLFGPVVDVPADAPKLDRLLGLSGRSPDWTP